jgi:hypothetical protein
VPAAFLYLAMPTTMSTILARTVLALILLLPSVAVAQTEPVALSPPVQTAPAPRVQLPVDALMQDAAEYARAFDLPLDDAMHRLRAQSDSIAATDHLRETYKDRWAGILVEHRPAYRIVILLTGSEPVPDQSIAAGGIVVPIVFHTGAAVTRERMLAAISTYQAQIRTALPHPPGLGIDPRTGEMVVMISGQDTALDRDGALKARFEAMTGVPVRIEAVDQQPVDMAEMAPTGAVARAAAVEGGARVVGTVDGRRYACTTGFVVTDGTRTGIVTAAHCPDVLTYVDAARGDVPLDYVGQWGWGFQDVQVNVVPVGMTLSPMFYADTAKTLIRPVSTWRYRTSTRSGDFVCHRGERTGYSCALVAMVDFAPAGDLCGGACLPTWVAVEGPTCKAGDSGAPVFDGTTALGLVKGGTYRRDGSCLFYYYMSTDYLPKGWSLAYAPAPSPLAPAAPIVGNSISADPAIPANAGTVR